MIHKYFYLMVFAVPELLGLSTSQVPYESDQLDVSWDLDPCVDLYSVYYQLINRDQCENLQMPREHYWDGNDTSLTIIGLEPYSTYNVIVIAYNTLGEVETSETNKTYITGTSSLIIFCLCCLVQICVTLLSWYF